MFSALEEYKDCNIGARPASALATRKGNSYSTIEDILNKASINDLATGGIVSSDIESLEAYSGTVEEYVKTYANYRNAVKNGPPTDGNAASSVLATFALQSVAILTFVFLS